VINQPADELHRDKDRKMLDDCIVIAERLSRDIEQMIIKVDLIDKEIQKKNEKS
jgi:hypothetical protein